MTVTIPYELWACMVAFIREQEQQHKNTDAPAGYEATRLMNEINAELAR